MGKGVFVSEVMHSFLKICCVFYFLLIVFTVFSVSYINLLCFHVAPIPKGMQTVRVFIDNLNFKRGKGTDEYS